MTEKLTIQVEAETLEEAREQLQAQIPEGLSLLQETVLSDGVLSIAKATANTAEEAFAKARGQIPANARLVERREVSTPERLVISVQAVDERDARAQVLTQVVEPSVVTGIRLITAGRRGFLGIGRTLDHYEAQVFGPSVVIISYKPVAKLSAEVGIPLWKLKSVVDLYDRPDYDAALTTLRSLVHSGVAVDEIVDTRYTGDLPLWVRMLDDGHEDAAKLAILAGADVNAERLGKSVLTLAARRGFGEIVALLLARGAAVNPEDGREDSPLGAASGAGNREIVDALLAAGADVNRRNEYGHTPLMGAAAAGNVDIMKRLVSSGADADAKDKMGHAAMYFAVANEKPAAIQYLTSIGAGSALPEKVQAIVSFSRRPISGWDAGELHRAIESTQHEMGHMTDVAVFRKENVVAGDSLDDQQYVYAYLRESLRDLGGHELMSRCYLHDFNASDGNSGTYVVVLDRPLGHTSTGLGLS